MKKASILPVLNFASARAFRTWLMKHHEHTDGIWLRFYKKGSGIKTVSYAEALDEALCFGWIDGQVKTYDADSWLTKFTPRRARSIWSKRNTENVARLIKEKRMHASGMKEVTAAKQDGRWDRAYHPSTSMQVPDDFIKALKRDKKAYAFFKTLNRANTYAIAWRLQTAARPETRAKRFDTLLAMLKQEKKLH